MISKVKGLDLGQESVKDLNSLLRHELYIDIDSEFAKEIQQELESREK
jgi:hypothetical protein